MTAPATTTTNLEGLSDRILAVPDGWKLVPVDPTPEMIAAASTLFREEREHASKVNEPGDTFMGPSGDGYYCAMLAAAPSAPTAGETAAPQVDAAPSWTCFHCAETFTTTESAMEHFGRSEYQKPGCQIDLAEYRRMEESHARHCDDDTDLHREIQRIRCEGTRAAERAEEAGYAKGLTDGKVLEIHAEHVVAWAASQWRAEVEHRPMQNIHRPRLDRKWRGLIQLLGANDVALIGPFAAPEVVATQPATLKDFLETYDASEAYRVKVATDLRIKLLETTIDILTAENRALAASAGAAPMQPVVMAKGRLRFRANTAVASLLDHATALGFGMNELAAEEHSDEDRMQLAQLVGYSIVGYGELSYVSDASYDQAESLAELATRTGDAAQDAPTIQQESITP